MKKLAELAVRFRVTFIMIYVLLLGSGAFFLTGLNLDMYPDITFPMIGVVTTYSGASPEDMEQLIVRPIEEACAAVEGVKHVNAEARAGAALVFVEFQWGTNLDQAETDIRRNLDLFRDLLPDDASDPITFAFDPSMEPILLYGVSGPYDQARLRRVSTHDIEPLLERVAGVAAAETLGGIEREILIEVLPDKLAASGISVNQIVGALRRENVELPGGEVSEGTRKLAIRAKGAYGSVDDIREVVVGVAGGVPVRLGDIAAVKDTVAEATRHIRVNQRAAIMLMVRKQSDANSVRTVEATQAVIPDIEQRLPAGVKLRPIFSQADFINLSLGNLTSTGYLSVAMTMIVLLVFLRSVRASIIVGLSIPVSVFVTFTAMYAAGLTLNIISMAGLALAIGMLVDNSIVVLENIYTHLDMGKTPFQAAIDGAAQVATAIAGSTLTTIAVFLPILFVPGLAGAMFRDMAMTICISLAVSLFVAVTLIPLAASVLIRRGLHAELSRLVQNYGRLEDLALRRRKTFFFASVLALLVSVGFIALNFYRGNTDFFPKEDRGLIIVQLKTQVGSGVDYIDRLSQVAEKRILEKIKEIELLTVDVGVGEGFAAMFSEGEHTGLVRARLKPLAQRTRRQWQIEEQLRDEFNSVPGLEARIFNPFSMGADEGDLTIKIFGHDLDQARRVGQDLKQRLAAHKAMVAGELQLVAKDVTFSMEEARPELSVHYDRPRLAHLGLSSFEVSSTISSFFQGSVASVLREEGQDYKIRVRAPLAYRSDPRHLGDLSVVSPIAGPVPLRSITKITEEAGPVKIIREDQQRLVKVSASALPGQLGVLTQEVDKMLASYPLPKDFSYAIGGMAEDMKESFGYLALAFLVSILLVYMVMASLYESFLTPFVIGLTVPLGMTGVGLALFLTGTSLSITALIGIVILVGIVVNNSIVLVDYANQLCALGKSRLEAIGLAGRRRLRPILMTTLTTVLGMVPLAFEIGEGAESWSPLARVVIGGLSFGTLITLFIVPIIYVRLGGGAAARAQDVAFQLDKDTGTLPSKTI